MKKPVSFLKCGVRFPTTDGCTESRRECGTEHLEDWAQCGTRPRKAPAPLQTAEKDCSCSFAFRSQRFVNTPVPDGNDLILRRSIPKPSVNLCSSCSVGYVHVLTSNNSCWILTSSYDTPRHHIRRTGSSSTVIPPDHACCRLTVHSFWLCFCERDQFMCIAACITNRISLQSSIFARMFVRVAAFRSRHQRPVAGARSSSDTHENTKPSLHSTPREPRQGAWGRHAPTQG